MELLAFAFIFGNIYCSGSALEARRGAKDLQDGMFGWNSTRGLCRWGQQPLSNFVVSLSRSSLCCITIEFLIVIRWTVDITHRFLLGLAQSRVIWHGVHFYHAFNQKFAKFHLHYCNYHYLKQQYPPLLQDLIDQRVLTSLFIIQFVKPTSFFTARYI